MWPAGLSFVASRFVDELAPLSRYLFIYLLIHLSLVTQGINK